MLHGECEKGDVLLTMEAPLGNVAQIPDSNKYILSQRVLLIKPKCFILRNYLSHYMEGSYFQGQLYLNSTGSTAIGIQRKKLDSVEVYIPPTKDEQEAIAGALSDVDALIDSLEQLISKKRLIKQGAMQELLSGKKHLTGFRGKWGIKKLGEIFTISASGDLIKKSFSPYQDESHCYPVYSNSLTGRGLYGYSKINRYLENCITVTARGTLGVSNARDHKFDAIGRVLVLVPNCDMNCFFISEHLNNNVRFSVESTGVPQLTAPQISKYEVLFPEPPEQNAIAQVLSDMDAEIDELDARLSKYQMIKQGMMQELLTGRIRLI
jgi:type I restriction enzyme S subunit